MSDVSTFIKRGHNDHEAINKLQALITPMAFPEPEESSQKERIILSSPVRLRTNTSSTGTDITTTNSETRERFSNSITILPDTSTPSAFPVSPTLSGTLTYTPSGQKFGCGATFNGSQYISIPDDSQLDSTTTFFTMAFWFKADGVHHGNQTIWSKGTFSAFRDFCLDCGDYDTGDYSTTLDSTISAGVQVKLEGNPQADYESVSSDFDSGYDTSTSNETVNVILSDGSNVVNNGLTATNLFDGNWHSIVIVSQDSQEDYCGACTDYDTGDYQNSGGSPTITVYMDKISLGTIDNSSISGDLSNTDDALMGAETVLGLHPIKGTLALFEYQDTNWATADIDAFHDDARVRVTSQKAAFHFTGNSEEETTLANIY
jgi:hypothetical protein